MLRHPTFSVPPATLTFGSALAISILFSVWAAPAQAQPAIYGSTWATQSEPWGINLTPAGNFWVCGVNADSIIEYTPLGSRLRSCGGTGSGPGQFRIPVAVNQDAGGNLFVSDYLNARVEKLSSACSYLTSWSTTWAGGIRCAYAALDASGNLYVTNLTNVAKKFASDGSELLSFTAPAGARLFGVGVDALGNVYFGDFQRDSILKFDASAGRVGGWRTGPGNSQIAIDTDRDRLYVADNTANHVEVYTMGGTRIGVFGTTGPAPERLNVPEGVAVAADHRIYVADRGNNRVVVFHRPDTFAATYESLWEGLPSDSCAGMHLALMNASTPTPPVLVNRLLRFQTSLCTDNAYYTSNEATDDIYIPDSLVMEAQCRLVSGTSCTPVRAPAAIDFTTEANRGNTLLIGENEIFLLSSNTARGQTASVKTTDRLHDYLITVYGDSVWVNYDGERKLSGTLVNDAVWGTQRQIVWGEVSGAGYGISDWEFFTDNAGRNGCPTVTGVPVGGTSVPRAELVVAPNPLIRGGRGGIDFRLPSSSNVDLAVFDLSGRRMLTLARVSLEPGLHHIDWSPQDAAAFRPGVVFLRLQWSGGVETRPVVVLN